MSRQTIAIIIVAVLAAQFALLLLVSLVRSRRAHAEPAEAAAAAAEPEPKKKPKPVTRREFFRHSLLSSLGLFAAQFGAASVAFLWPNLRGGFGAAIDVKMTPEEVRTSISQDRQPFYFGAGRFYLVNYTGTNEGGLYDGFVADGIMALFQRCVHLGCRVPFCEQSQWFECPCHGSKYNIAGEYRDGPAPRGLDRFPVSISPEGTVVVDTSVTGQQNGPARGTVTTQPEPEGAFCINVTGEEG